MALRAKRYFQDHEVQTVLKNGKTVRKYVYQGDWYVRQTTPAARRAERIAYLPLAALAGGLLLAAMSRPVPTNISGVLAALSLLALIAAFCVLEGVAEAFFRKGDLTKNDYYERLVMLRVMPAAGAALLLLLTAGYLRDAFGGQNTGAALWAAAFAGVAAAVYAGIAVREFRVQYQIVKGPGAAQPQPGGKP